MNVKDLLSNYRDNTKDILSIAETEKAARKLADNANERGLYEICEKYQADAERRKSRIEHLIRDNEKIEGMIEKVDDSTSRELLRRRYIAFQEWEKIAVEMNYTYKHLVAVLHPKALKVFERCNKIRQNVIENDLKTLL